MSPRRDALAARRFFAAAIMATGTEPAEVMTDRARIYPAVLDEDLPRCVPQRGAVRQQCRGGRSRTAEGPGAAHARTEAGPVCPVIIAGRALVQNVRRGVYELGVATPANRGLAAAFAQLAMAI